MTESMVQVQALQMRAESGQGLGPSPHRDDDQDTGKVSLCTLEMSTRVLCCKASGATAQPPALDSLELHALNRLRDE